MKEFFHFALERLEVFSNTYQKEYCAMIPRIFDNRYCDLIDRTDAGNANLLLPLMIFRALIHSNSI